MKKNWTIPGDAQETISWATAHWIKTANEAIANRGAFFVALSGGSTPHALYKQLANHKADVDFKRVHLFWSDERAVGATDPENNARMALEAGLGSLPIPKEQIHPISGQGDLEANALHYQDLIAQTVPRSTFDLIMLGVGEDGHTASLFPKTEAIDEKKHLVCPNWVASQHSWRLTFTYPLIEKARLKTFYAIGIKKAPIIYQILKEQAPLPATAVTDALWVLDHQAASLLSCAP